MVEALGNVMFVRPDGTWVCAGEFDGVLGDADPDYDPSLYAIKNFGFVLVRISESSVVEIELHPRNVTTAALFATQSVLSSIRFSSFRITYLKDDWTSETASSATSAICRLSEICAREGSGIICHEPTALVH